MFYLVSSGRCWCTWHCRLKWLCWLKWLCRIKRLLFMVRQWNMWSFSSEVWVVGLRKHVNKHTGFTFTARICSRVLIFVALTRLQSSYSCFTSAASSWHSHLCFHIVNSLLISYSDGSSSEYSSTAGCSVATSFVMKPGISPISDSVFSWEEPKRSVKWLKNSLLNPGVQR